MTTNTFGCARCTHRWTGYNTAHCGACHETFTGISAFDAHRRDGQCAHPTTVGLTLTQRSYLCWGSGVPNDYRVSGGAQTDENHARG